VDCLASFYLLLKPLSHYLGHLPGEARVRAGKGKCGCRGAAWPTEAGEPPAGAQVSMACGLGFPAATTAPLMPYESVCLIELAHAGSGWLRKALGTLQALTRVVSPGGTIGL
jgi:hypothetical protein